MLHGSQFAVTALHIRACVNFKNSAPTFRKGELQAEKQKISGRGDRIRTCDPLLPKQMRYQAALLPDTGKNYTLLPNTAFRSVVGPEGLEPPT